MRIVREGWPFIIGCLVASDIFLLCAIFLKYRSCVVLAVVFLILTAFCAYFFRDPARVVPQDPKLVLSPADGKVLEVIEAKDSSSREPVWMIRIFLSVFDAHLQRSPMAGRVGRIQYTKGKFLDARDPKAHFENEQNRIEIESSDGAHRFVVTQIAGLIARRIVCWVKEGQTVQAGERMGLIRFGSQVDVVLPKTCRIKVKAGDVVRAGDGILAEL
jgi:phosphatidylserine decarboxylase